MAEEAKPTAEFWVTKDGRVLPYHEITDQHLDNIIRYIERHEGWRAASLTSLRNERETRKKKSKEPECKIELPEKDDLDLLFEERY